MKEKTGVKTVKVKVKIKLKRSNVPPKTKADKKLSVAHLKDSIAYNKRHIADHRKVEKKGGSKEYNEDHIKHHKKAMEKDKKLLEKRQKEAKKKRALGPAKAKQMLKDNSAQGHKLTSRQKKYFGWIAGGKKQRGIIETGGVGTPFQQLSSDAAKIRQPFNKQRTIAKLKRGMRGYKGNKGSVLY